MSSKTDSVRSIRIERAIGAPPEKLWSLVADITQMGTWSPENTGGQWVAGADGPALGARFKGTNSNGSRSWSSDCVVTACEPGKLFSFDVTVKGLKVAGWTYEFEPLGDGCRVVETWNDHRSALVTWLAPLATGTKDRAARNRETMVHTLERLAATAEGS
jgi:uncharacterized protein YndB with AHSA1/START domain